MTRKQEIEEMVVDAYINGACDSADIFLYVSSLMSDVSFDEVDEVVLSIFGPINMTEARPTNYLLN